MTCGEMNVRATIVAAFINELFMDGVESKAFSFLHNGLTSSSIVDSARNMVNNIINYFESSEKPTEEFLHFIGVDSKYVGNDQQSIKTLMYMDENKTPFLTDVPVAGDGVTVLNSALALYFLGMKNNADSLTKIGVKLFMEGVFRDEISLIEFDDISRKAISEAQREKAKKPRNPYHTEVINVIRLTWEKYPFGAKTALLDALSVHYHGKVSRNALDSWISLSGLRPPKPEKYTRLELVFPH